MPIQSSTHLGSYEIVSAIGAGGMVEVYRARDSKLGRDVAIKVLPQTFARDADGMTRFQREEPRRLMKFLICDSMMTDRITGAAA